MSHLIVCLCFLIKLFEARNKYKKKIEEKKKGLLEILKQVKGTCEDTDKLICDYLFIEKFILPYLYD